ncbi:MAG: hypothetical protein R6U96_04680 [Promethearchaeia archaeon]
MTKIQQKLRRMSNSKMEHYQFSSSLSTCKSCGTEITTQNRFSNLPCNHYCCHCCSHKEELPCPREKEFGTILDNIKSNTREQILKAIDRKKIFIGYMMLCRYLKGSKKTCLENTYRTDY